MTDNTEDEIKRQKKFDKDRLENLKEQAQVYEKDNGVPIDITDFDFLLSKGGIIIEQNKSSADNYYLHKLEISFQEDGRVYKFKTLTEKIQDFDIPF